MIYVIAPFLIILFLTVFFCMLEGSSPELDSSLPILFPIVASLLSYIF